METLGVKGWLKDWLEFASPGNRAPMEYHLAVGLAILGAYLARDAKVAINTGHSHLGITPRMSAFLVGKSGQGKGTAIGWGTALLSKMIPLMNDDTLPVLQDESSQEYLMDWLSRNSWALVVAEEASTMLGGARDYKRGLIESLTAAMDERDSYHVNFLKRRKLVERPLITSLWGSTPTWLADILTGKTALAGFPARCCWIFGAKRIRSPSHLRTDEDWDAITNRLFALAKVESNIDWSDAAPKTPAVKWFKNWSDHFHDVEIDTLSVGEKADSWFQRKDVWVLRGAMVKAVSEGENVPRVDDLEWAKGWVERMEKPYVSCLASLGTEGKLDTQHLLIRELKNKGGNATAKELFRIPVVRATFQKPEDMLHVLDALHYAGEVVRAPGGGGTRFTLAHYDMAEKEEL